MNDEMLKDLATVLAVMATKDSGLAQKLKQREEEAEKDSEGKMGPDFKFKDPEEVKKHFPPERYPIVIESYEQENQLVLDIGTVFHNYMRLTAPEFLILPGIAKAQGHAIGTALRISMDQHKKRQSGEVEVHGIEPDLSQKGNALDYLAECMSELYALCMAFAANGQNLMASQIEKDVVSPLLRAAELLDPNFVDDFKMPVKGAAHLDPDGKPDSVLEKFRVKPKADASS